MDEKLEKIIIENNNENEIDLKNLALTYIISYDRFLTKVSIGVCRKCQRLELDDVKQQLILTLFTNMNAFKEDRQANINTYFSQIILNASKTIIKRYWQVKNKVNVECVSIDSYIKEEDNSEQFISLFKEKSDSIMDPENYYVNKEMIEKMDEVISTFTPFERTVFELYMKGYSIEEIAEKVKKSKKTIYNTISSIKDRIKKNM